MSLIFYDNTRSYDDNWKMGPPLAKQNIAPPKRTIKKGCKFLGFEVNVPFGIPAGPLLNSKFVKTAFEWGFDVVHYKTQRSAVFPCNPFPNVLFVDVNGNLTLKKANKPLLGRLKTKKKPLEFNITNSFGNPSRGPQVWQEDMRKARSYEKEGQLLIASVVGTIKKGFDEEDYFDDFAHTAKLANETGVKVIEVNLSCPNVANEGILCYSPQAVEAITRKVKEAIGETPLLVKVGYYDNNQQPLLKKIVKSIIPFISGIAAINTIPAPVVDEKGNQALPGPNRLKAGICGAGIKWAGLDMVQRLARLREKLHADYEILGVGGVMTPADYLEYRKAGADAVQSATAAMWNPYLAYEISKEGNKK
ncbi:MAG: diguanylate cyclase [bacterium]|nr:diguanylate cyclase [bacterium]